MTKYYDGYGRRVPSPRDDERPSSLAVTVVCIILIIAIAAALTCLAPKVKVPKADESPTITHDSLAPTYTHDGEIIRWYVFVDPDTGVQYLYNDHSWVATPRLDRDGEQMGTLDERSE